MRDILSQPWFWCVVAGWLVLLIAAAVVVHRRLVAELEAEEAARRDASWPRDPYRAAIDEFRRPGRI
jgi:hypothetical protein